MPTVRQQVLIDAPPRAVWKAVTTPEGITTWWSAAARVDAREGGRIVLGFPGEGDALVEEVGLVHKFKPTASFQIHWDNVGASPLKGTKVEFQIGQGGGETKVHVIVSGSALDDEELAGKVDADWKRRLTALRDGLEA